MTDNPTPAPRASAFEAWLNGTCPSIFRKASRINPPVAFRPQTVQSARFGS